MITLPIPKSANEKTTVILEKSPVIPKYSFERTITKIILYANAIIALII